MGFCEEILRCIGGQAGFWVFGLEEVVELVFARPILVATLPSELFFELCSLCDGGFNPLAEVFQPSREKNAERAIKTPGFEPDPQFCERRICNLETIRNTMAMDRAKLSLQGNIVSRK